MGRNRAIRPWMLRKLGGAQINGTGRARLAGKTIRLRDKDHRKFVPQRMGSAQH